MPERRIATHEELRQIADLYVGGLSIEKSAKKLGYGYYVGKKAIDTFGIKARTNSETHRKYGVDETYFEEIDTEEKAYWLGFISADGNIGNNSLTIGLKLSDRKHLEKLKKDIKSEHRITQTIQKIKDKEYDGCRIIVCSKKICEDLKKLGVLPAKSKILKPCPFVPEHLKVHYWRGMVDGDGCIRENGGDWTTGLCGTQDVCAAFEMLLRKNMDLDFKKIERVGDNLYIVRYGGIIQVKKILFLLYDKANVFLSRKYELSKKLIYRKDVFTDKKFSPIKYNGFSPSGKKLLSGICFKGDYLKLGRWEHTKNAYIAHKSAWFKKCIENCEDGEEIREYAKKSAENPDKWVKETLSHSEIEENVKEYILSVYKTL